MKVKNGNIELMRFIFCLTVIFRHINFDIWGTNGRFTENITFFFHGYISVEFFFLVSGYLMAKTIKRQWLSEKENGYITNVGDGALKFLWHKVKGILPYHIVFSIMVIVLNFILFGRQYIWKLLDGIPSLFFLQKLGLGNSQILNVEWYISSMLFVMLLLYPFCKKYYITFSHYVAPLISLVLIGYLQHTTGYISGSTKWCGTTFKCNLRAIAVLCLGIVLYEICQKLCKIEFSKQVRFVLSVVETFCYGLTFMYMCTDYSNSYEIYVLGALCIAVAISFSEVGILSNSRLLRNKFVYFLGAISLPVYLAQNFVRLLVPKLLPDCSNKMQAIIIVAGTVLLGTVAYMLNNMRKKNADSY